MELTSDNSFEKLLCLLQLICLNLEFPVAFSTFKETSDHEGYFRTGSGETRFDHFAENLLEKITIFSRSKQNYVGQLFSIYFVSLSGSAAAATKIIYSFFAAVVKSNCGEFVKTSM